MSKRQELEARQREATRKRNLQIGGIIAAIAVVVIGGAIAITRLNPGASKLTVALPPMHAFSKAVPPGTSGKEAAWGPVDAPIKIEEFIDYQCPACGAQWSANEDKIIAGLLPAGKVRYEYRAMPWVGENESIDAAQASYCAADQGKFFEMHNALFANQLGENKGNFSKDRLKQLGNTIGGLDGGAFATCLDGDTHRQQSLDNRAEFDKRKIADNANAGTPSFWVNGKPFVQARSLEDLIKAANEVAPGVLK